MAKKSTDAKSDGSTKTRTGKDAETIIKHARDLLEHYQEREGDNIRRAEEAIRFRAGEQWPDAIRQDRENPSQDGGPRPCPVLDKTNQYVRTVVNEERQNRAAIKIRPVDDIADPKVAEVYTGIIRHIEDSSNALTAYTTAGEHAIDGGFGYWRILTEYCDPMSFDQDIRIKRIPNRFSVALGPHSEPDGSDAREALVWEDMEVSVFKAAYPKAKADGFDNTDSWAGEDMIRVAEYMRIEPETRTIHLMPDGSVWTDAELSESGLDGSYVIDKRTTQINRVRWYKLTAQEILEEKEMIGSYIPVVKVIGNELVMPDGKSRLSGMVEQAMDPQRLHNYAHAGFIEHVALAPRAPWTAPAEAVTGYEPDYSAANRRNIVLLKYNHTDAQGNPLPSPQRTPPAGIAPGWQQMLMNTEHGIEASVGMYGPTVGARSQEKSGVALQEQKSAGMVGNFHFPDNLARSIQHTGRILLEWIPKVYDTERVARMLGDDGSHVIAYLNPEQEQAVMPRLDRLGKEIGKSYNLNVGKYDVTVSVGPSYTAKRQEAAQNQIQLLQAKPELLNFIGDIVFGNMDWPGADKIAKRLKAMLPPPIQQLDQDGQENATEQKQAQLAQMAQALEQQAHALFQKEQELKAMAEQVQEAGAQGSQQQAEMEALRKDIIAERKLLSAEQARFAAEVELFKERAQTQGKQYEADRRYDAEIVKAAAQIVSAKTPTGVSLNVESALTLLAEEIDRIHAAQNQGGEVREVLTGMES